MAPTILLPPILTSSNAATWLSTRGHKKLGSVASIKSRISNDNEDLSKWLAGGKKRHGPELGSEGKQSLKFLFFRL